MTYSEYTNLSEFYTTWKVNFPTFFKILDNKYFDFNVLYEVQSLDKMIIGFLAENYNELTKFLELEKQLADVFLKENYGNFNNMDVINLPDETSSTILSYDGLSDKGEFNRTTTKHVGVSTNNTKNKSVNNLEVFLNLNQIKLNAMYKELTKDFGYKFLRLWYN